MTRFVELVQWIWLINENQISKAADLTCLARTRNSHSLCNPVEVEGIIACLICSHESYARVLVRVVNGPNWSDNVSLSVVSLSFYFVFL